MKKICMFNALLISGLIFGSLYGQQKFDFAAAGFNEQFVQDTLKALDAAYRLNAYNKFNDNDKALDVMESNDWFERSMRQERNEIVKSTEGAGDALRKVSKIARNTSMLAQRYLDEPAIEWGYTFEEKSNDRGDKDRAENENYLVEEISSIKNKAAWAATVQKFKDDIEMQKGIIRDYENKYSEILKVIGCSKKDCDPSPPLIKKEL